MRIAYYVYHAMPAHAEGHWTRFRALQSVIPELVLVDDVSRLHAQWDIVLVDSYPLGKNRELVPILPVLRERGTKTVLIARAVNERYSGYPWDYDAVLVPGPYEGTEGSLRRPADDPRQPKVVDPMVTLGLPRQYKDPGIDVLLVPASAQSPDWWELVAGLYQHSTLDHAHWQIARSNIVVGTGGAGTLYEALYSGCRYVALPLNVEQGTRIENAIAAGEAIIRVDHAYEIERAVAWIRGSKPLGRREISMVPALEVILATLAVPA